MTLSRRQLARFLALPLASCAAYPSTPPAWEDLPGWQEERVATALPALLSACLGRLPPYVCTDEAAARAFLRTAFTPAAPQRVDFTGYFSISLPGARSPGPRFQTPVLRPSAESGRYDRAAILGGALAGRGLELAWLRNPADLFFLQLQGSGRITLEEGGVLDVTSAGSNGRAPIDTARLFATADVPNNDLSITALRAWVASHPGQGLRRLAIDPSYVFFREGRARGASGALLTPMRSLAVDPASFPLGRPVWIAAGRLQRLMVAQDTGAPIRGARRADIFFGAGPAAEVEGGQLDTTGYAWQLLPTGRVG